MLDSSPNPADIQKHNCSSKTMVSDSDGVEKFVGKIVYNKQGSAYIIDDQLPESNNRKKIDISNNSEGLTASGDGAEDSARKQLKPLEESAMLRPLLSPLKDQLKDIIDEGVVEDISPNRNEGREENTASPASHPSKISNAFYVTRSAAYYNTLYGQAYAKMLRDRMVLPTPDSPIVHSYKVYSMRDENNQDKSGNITIYRQVCIHIKAPKLNININ